MKPTLIPFCIVLLIPLLVSCSFNPFTRNNHETGDPAGAVIGAGIGAGGVAALGGTKFTMGLAGIAGGTIGYYVTTLRYASGGIMQAGGQVYKVGALTGIYIPSDKLFEPNTADFLPEAPDILDSTVDVLRRYPNNSILISGNTSGFYRDKWEQRLSERRAEKVASYLWREGINNFKTPENNLRQLDYVGYGDYFPLSQTLTNTGIRQNSRIQIVSYATDCRLPLDKFNARVHNVGALNKEMKRPCQTMDSEGRCLE